MSAQLLSQSVQLDIASHKYSFGGRAVPGVTQILRGLGLVNEQWFTDWARDRGSAVHAGVEYLIRGRLDWSTVDPRIEGYLAAAQKFLEDSKADLSQIQVERKVFNEGLFYAGRVDAIGKFFGDECILDWKSGQSGLGGLQTAAYSLAYRSEVPGKPMARLVVQLAEHGGYKLTRYTKASDILDWMACCRIYNGYLGKE